MLFLLNEPVFICWLSDGDSDQDLGEDDDFSKLYARGLPPNPTHYSYLNLTDSHSLPGGASFDISPLSSPEKELGGKSEVVAGKHDDSTLSKLLQL